MRKRDWFDRFYEAFVPLAIFVTVVLLALSLGNVIERLF
jgi:hypothetical protein